MAPSTVSFWLGEAVPMRRAAPRPEDERRQLRALGYLID